MKLPRGTSGKNRGRGYLDGQMLIAMPAMLDDRFARSLIYICAHSAEGAMGIIVNHPAPNINFSDLLVKLDVIPAADVIQLPSRAGVVKVMRGGPVETERGFVLHSADFFIENSTISPIDESSASVSPPRSISQSDRPRRRAGERVLGLVTVNLGSSKMKSRAMVAIRRRIQISSLRHRHRQQIRQGAEELH